jgi:hypothetical protein
MSCMTPFLAILSFPLQEGLSSYDMTLLCLKCQQNLAKVGQTAVSVHGFPHLQALYNNSFIQIRPMNAAPGTFYHVSWHSRLLSPLPQNPLISQSAVAPRLMQLNLIERPSYPVIAANNELEKITNGLPWQRPFVSFKHSLLSLWLFPPRKSVPSPNLLYSPHPCLTTDEMDETDFYGFCLCCSL